MVANVFVDVLLKINGCGLGAGLKVIKELFMIYHGLICHLYLPRCRLSKVDLKRSRLYVYGESSGVKTMRTRLP